MSTEKWWYTDELKPINPKYPKGIVFHVTDSYIAYFSVTLQSFLERVKPNKEYDIVVMTTDISEVNVLLLRGMVKPFTNISLRFYNPHKWIVEFRKTQKIVTFNPTLIYTRMSLPWICEHYDVILDLDVDLIVAADLDVILDVKWQDDQYIAAAPDYGYEGFGDVVPAMKKILGIAQDSIYINCGVQVNHVKAIRRDFAIEDMQKAMNDRYAKHDISPVSLPEQDVFNVVYENHILYLDSRWNVFPDNTIVMRGILFHSDLNVINRWLSDQKEAYIVHYAGNPKPWKDPYLGGSRLWWNMATKTPCFEQLLAMAKKNLADELARYRRS